MVTPVQPDAAKIPTPPPPAIPSPHASGTDACGHRAGRHGDDRDADDELPGSRRSRRRDSQRDAAAGLGERRARLDARPASPPDGATTHRSSRPSRAYGSPTDFLERLSKTMKRDGGVLELKSEIRTIGMACTAGCAGRR